MALESKIRILWMFPGIKELSNREILGKLYPQVYPKTLMSPFKNSLHFRNVNIYTETGGKTPEEKLRDRFKEYGSRSEKCSDFVV